MTFSRVSIPEKIRQFIVLALRPKSGCDFRLSHSSCLFFALSQSARALDGETPIFNAISTNENPLPRIECAIASRSVSDGPSVSMFIYAARSRSYCMIESSKTSTTRAFTRNTRSRFRRISDRRKSRPHFSRARASLRVMVLGCILRFVLCGFGLLSWEIGDTGHKGGGERVAFTVP